MRLKILMGFFLISITSFTQTTKTGTGYDTSCGIVWLPPVKLSPGNTNGYTPKLASQGNTIHLTYWYSGDFQLPYTRSTDGGITWEPVRDLYDSTTYPTKVGGPFFAINNKKLFIFFHGGPYGGTIYRPYMITSIDSGVTWSKPVRLTDTTYKVHNIRDVAIWGDTMVIAVGINELTFDRTLFSTDGGESWTIATGSVYAAAIRSIALTKNWTHEFHNIYIDNYSFEIIHKRSSNFGMSWQDSNIISSLDYYGGGSPFSICTPDNDLLVNWTDAKYGCRTWFGCSRILKISHDEGLTWSNEIVVTDTPWAMSGILAVRKPVIAATWGADEPNLNIEMNISFDYGNSWCGVFNVTPPYIYPCYSLNSDITLSEKTVIISYEQRDIQGAPFQIWVRVGLLPTNLISDNKGVPANYNLFPAYPNPFNFNTTIKYNIPKSDIVNISIYNILGEKITTLVNEHKNPGTYEVTWEADNYSSGIYICRITAGNFTSSNKLLLIK